jgi:hypothetical protein
MEFEYEITADQFVASQFLYHKLTDGRKHRQSAVQWILAGILLLAVAWIERPCLNWTDLVLTLIAVWWIYAGLVSLFPARHFRRAYFTSDLVGKRFKANVGEEGFEVTGDDCSWRVRWPGVRVKGEDAQIFMLYSHGTIFVFGKNHLNGEQQERLRRLSGLT